MPTYSSYNALGNSIETTEITNSSITSIKLADEAKGLNNIGEIEVTGADATYVEFTGLDGDTDGTYILEALVKNTVAASEIYLTVNGDNTVTNYYTQFLQSLGAAVNGNLLNYPRLVFVGGGEETFTECTILRDSIDVLRANAKYNSQDATGPRVGSCFIVKTAATTNIVTIRITAQTADALSIGSRFRLWARK